MEKKKKKRDISERVRASASVAMFPCKIDDIICAAKKDDFCSENVCALNRSAGTRGCVGCAIGKCVGEK